MGPREPCPCGSGRRYKACHGRAGGAGALVRRPFEGLGSEPDWVALREVVPAATAPLRLRDGRSVTLATVLPAGWAAMVRADGSVFVALQTTARSGDISRDIAAAMLEALEGEPGSAVGATGNPGQGPRLQDLVDPGPLTVTVHRGFDFWLEGVAEPGGEDAAALERANAAVVPTERLPGDDAAYWCRIGEATHLRWVLDCAEDDYFDTIARLQVRSELDLGPGTRYVGAFRAHGLVVPVWDLAPGAAAADVAPPAQEWRGRFETARAGSEPLSGDERRARAGLVSRQVTLR